MKRLIIAVFTMIISLYLFSCGDNSTNPQEEHYVKSVSQSNWLMPFTNGNTYKYRVLFNREQPFDTIDCRAHLYEGSNNKGGIFVNSPKYSQFTLLDVSIFNDGKGFAFDLQHFDKSLMYSEMAWLNWGYEEIYVYKEEVDNHRYIWKFQEGVGLIELSNYWWDDFMKNFVLDYQLLLLDFNLK